MPARLRTTVAAIALVLAVSACADRPPDTPEPAATTSPSATGPAASSAPSTPTPPPAPAPDPGPVLAPSPTSCSDIGTTADREAWAALGFTLEPFDGPQVGGPVGYADSLAPYLAVHCALWGPDRELGAYLLVEWYVGIDAQAFLAQPYLADFDRTDIPTDTMTMRLVASEVEALVGSAEYLVAHEDTLLRIFSNGFDVAGSGQSGFDAMLTMVQGVWHEVG